MALLSTTIKVSYDCDGETTLFPITFTFNANTDIIVTLRNPSGAEETLTLTTDYSISSLNVETVETYDSGYILVISRDTSVTQERDWQANSALSAASLEDSLDKLTMICQEIDERVSRSLCIPISDELASVTIPVEADRANKVLAFDDDGDIEMVATIPDLLTNLTPTEVDQLENIDLVTISNAQWGYLGDLDQALATTDSPTFGAITITGAGTIGSTLAVTGVATFTAQPIFSSLTASRAVFTDGSKGLVSNAITGTGNVVMSASPTFTGTITAASLTLSGAFTGGASSNITINTNKFTVTASSGNTVVAGTLGVTGAATLGSTLSVGAITTSGTNFTTAAGGMNIVTGTADGYDSGRNALAGGGSVALSRSAYVAAHGNEHATEPGELWLSAGTVTGGDIVFTANSERMRITQTGEIQVNTNKVVITCSNGNTAIAGTLGVTGATTLSSTVAITGAVTLGGDVSFSRGAANVLTLASGDKVALGGETEPDISAGGICLNQGTEDTNILSFKSSDVEHGMTSHAETDTYALFKKQDSNSGGLAIFTFSEATDAFKLTACATTEDNGTPHDEYSQAIISFEAYKKSGTSLTSLSADTALFSLSGGDQVFLVLASGDIYTATDQTGGLAGTYDDENDLMLARAAQLKIGGDNEYSFHPYRDRLEELGIIKNGFVSHHKMMGLELGALGQLFKMVIGIAKAQGITEKELFKMAVAV